jgi:hypothetical protein
MQKIDLDIDKENELVFKVSIEGTKPAKPTSRFLLESKDFSIMFPTQSHVGNEVTILIPCMEKILKEGSYVGTLEVIIDDRVFTPIKVDTKFEKSINVMAESVVNKRKETKVSVDSVVAVNKSKIRDEDRNKDKDLMSESKAKTSSSRSAPRQRNRVRPPQNKRNKVSLLETRIRKIAQGKGVRLSESQVREIVKQYRLTKE